MQKPQLNGSAGNINWSTGIVGDNIMLSETIESGNYVLNVEDDQALWAEECNGIAFTISDDNLNKQPTANIWVITKAETLKNCPAIDSSETSRITWPIYRFNGNIGIYAGHQSIFSRALLDQRQQP